MVASPSLEQVAERPVRTLESGPAAGVVGAAAFGMSAGFDDVISFDMGGTTAKAALVSSGVPATTTYFELQRIESRRGSGLPVDIPALDLVEVGTGGGSIAEVREGTLRVGPLSAGADPGPACYGRGGTAATVTDANLLLGYYDPSVFAGGVVLDVAAAEAAIDRLAAELGVDRLHASWGIHEVATLNMEHAIRLVSINRGFDPREHAVVCTGGAGPAHGPRLARALGATVAVIPRAASGGSARGLLEAVGSSEVTRTALVDLGTSGARERCVAVVRELVVEAAKGSFGAGGDSEVRLVLGMRYRGQGYELFVPIDPGERDPEAIAEAFHRRYEQAYGYRDDAHAVEIVTWHLSLVRPSLTRGATRSSGDRGAPTRGFRRHAYFPETGLMEVAVHDRERLRPGKSSMVPAWSPKRPRRPSPYPVTGSRWWATAACWFTSRRAHDRRRADRRRRLGSPGGDRGGDGRGPAADCLLDQVREGGDYSTAVFDAAGRMVAQANRSPAHLGAMPDAVRNMLAAYPPETLEPGDVIVLNDPYLGAGHLPDLFAMSPAFSRDRLVGFVASCVHLTDVGGPAPGSQAVVGIHDLVEEGCGCSRRSPTAAAHRCGRYSG